MADLPGMHMLTTSSALAGRNLRDVERECIVRTLQQANFNMSEASRILGVTRMTLYNKIREYGLTIKRAEKS